MKVFKELPKSIYNSCKLHFTPIKRFKLDSKPSVPVIISLTSIPLRLNTLHLVIKSLFNQTHKPHKIILWLHESLKNNIPNRLKKLESSEVFEIQFTHLTCSHKKLIHTIKLYPNHSIITCDDDLIYAPKLLVNLYNESLKHPYEIVANVVTQIQFDDAGNYLPFSKWRYKTHSNNPKVFLPIGAWGILYPPNSLSPFVFDETIFLKLTPRADDLWFKGMALLNGTISRKSTNWPGDPIPILGTQKIALKKENIKQNKNDAQWLALSKHYNLKSLINDSVE